MKKTKAKKITLKQRIVRIRCKCAQRIWPDAGPIATFIALRRMEFITPTFEFPDDWGEPISLNKGNLVVLEPILIVNGIKHRCAIVPVDGKPIRIW